MKGKKRRSGFTAFEQMEDLRMGTTIFLFWRSRIELTDLSPVHPDAIFSKPLDDRAEDWVGPGAPAKNNIF